MRGSAANFVQKGDTRGKGFLPRDCAQKWVPPGESEDSHPDDGGDAGELLPEGAVGGAGDVQHGVGHVLFGLVDHVLDVQAGGGGQGGDLADDARLVAVDDADAASAGAGLLHVGHIHRVGDVAVAQVVAQLLRGHNGAVVLGFGGGGAQVRGADDAGLAQQLLGGKVGHVGRHLAAFQRVEDGRVVHQLAAGVVQHLDAVLAQGQGLGVDGVAGGGQVGHMDGQIVAQGQHIVQIDAVVHPAAQVPGGVDGDVRGRSRRPPCPGSARSWPRGNRWPPGR